MDDEGAIPRLLVDTPVDCLEELASEVSRLREAGVDGLLIGTEGAIPGRFEDLLKQLAADPRRIRLMIAGDPRLAAAIGADLLLAEGAMATAAARRLLVPGALVGREVESGAAARLVAGLDFVVTTWTESTMASGAFRATIESAPCPVVWRVGDEAAAAGVFGAGGEGVILPFRNADQTGATARRVTAALPKGLPQRREVVVNGEAVDLPLDTAVADLLVDLGLTPSRVIRNGVIVPRRAWEDRLLAPGDVIETDH